MSTRTEIIKFADLEATVNFKQIKNIHLNILPPDGTVRVAAPLFVSSEAVRVFLVSRLPWIRRMQNSFNKQIRQTKRKYISGETHYLFGSNYRLQVMSDESSVSVQKAGKSKIILKSPEGLDFEKKEAAMNSWYRELLHDCIAEYVKKWSTKLELYNFEWSIRKMKTKWGSCNTESRRLLFNLELAKKPVNCIEYVVLHELIHLIVKKHNTKFVELLSKNMPKWETRREELNSMILTELE